MTQSPAFPRNQQRTARAAFGQFDPGQARRIFAREHDSGHEPIVLEVAPRTYFLQPGMVNVALFETDEGLVLVDCGCAGDGPALLRAVRSISAKPLHTVVFTHGHIDHAFGLWSFLDAGERPEIIAHENVPAHFDRYRRTAGLNARINGQLPGRNGKAWPVDESDFDWPTRVFRDSLTLTVGGERFELRHGKGETDDATWVWAPERGTIAAGDLVTGYLPNAGNPKKVQRYAEEWAEAADEMAALAPEVIIPGHGDPVSGVEQISDELHAMARYLRHIVDHALAGLNAGQAHDEIVDSLRIPAELAEHPRLQARYDKPEFLCRNVIRRYSGWWDGRPANLLPAPASDRAAEIASLAGGADVLIERAYQLAGTDLRLACHLAEWAFLAEPGDARAQQCYTEVLEQRAQAEPALMAQVNFRVSRAWARRAREAHGTAEGEPR
ncbi:alkyl sulfatase dimerization domain-containing protein [Haloactinomyces albus]|uniref:Alkyl sulfatase BDS1-like metallo-beta-lactamase superfamily hydrolase n=1 Tax=Haloactinomyces albus TaxID=1352928 RepID=A0AAE4CRL7_9ACTN|nr:alkyl sulfatase dimerization domain-containing protein [Haloactinomyces albus]MDR7303838.1 alkyl sulfatase BDS1-like metallo-beta-lactamase superfamily hydrolase [Haloactinomyces albus]